MGIYSSNRFSSVGSLNLDSVTEADTSYNCATGCAMAFLETQYNDLNMFNGIIRDDFKEAYAIREGYDVVNEASTSISNIFERIKEMLKKLIAKIKGIFGSFLTKLTSFTKDNKKLYDDYHKKISNYYKWKGFKVKKFRKQKMSGNIVDNIKTVGAYSVTNNEYNSVNVIIDELEDLDHDELMDKVIKSRLHDNIKDNIDTDLNNMNDEIMNALFEDEELVDEWNSSDILSGIVGGVLNQGNKIEIEIKKINDSLVKAVNKMAEDINKFALNINKAYGDNKKTKIPDLSFSLSKSDNGKYNNKKNEISAIDGTPFKLEATEDLSKIAGTLQKLVGCDQELVTKLTSGVLFATKFLISQARRVWTSAAAFTQVEHKNESYEYYTAVGESYEYDFLTGMESVY